MVFSKIKKSPILVTGAFGMLGSDLVEEISRVWGKDSVIPTDSRDLDITDRHQVEKFFKHNSISYVINAAAYTDVDGAENEREKAYRINFLGPKNLVEAANPIGIPVVHFSTDYVFDGTGNRPLTEEDKPNPPRPNYYGETKLLGEEAVLKNPINLVLRLQWLYGKKRERFTILKSKSSFTPFEDQWGAPTWTRDVCRVVTQLIQSEAQGLFHFAYDDFANWFEVYSFVRDELKLQTTLLPKKLSEVSLPAKRPNYGVMSNKKLLSSLGMSSMGSWKSSLREFLQTLSTQ